MVLRSAEMSWLQCKCLLHDNLSRLCARWRPPPTSTSTTAHRGSPLPAPSLIDILSRSYTRAHRLRPHLRDSSTRSRPFQLRPTLRLPPFRYTLTILLGIAPFLFQSFALPPLSRSPAFRILLIQVNHHRTPTFGLLTCNACFRLAVLLDHSHETLADICGRSAARCIIALPNAQIEEGVQSRLLVYSADLRRISQTGKG